MFIVHVASYKWVNNKRYAVVGRAKGASGWFGTTFPTFEAASHWFNMFAEGDMICSVNGVRQLYHAEIRQCEVESSNVNLYYATIAGAKNLVQQLADSEAVLAKCQELADGGDDTMHPANMSSGAAVP